MVLKFETRENPIKTLIYGLDGTGKSTAAETYCKKKGLNPVVIDVDKTNYTDIPILEVDLTRDITIVKNITGIIKDIKEDENFDTLIIDGVGSLLDLLTPNIKGQQAYLQRSRNFKKIWKCLLESNINIIFIGQKDLIITEENESSRLAEKINNMVDWKFRCYREGNVFKSECTKWRRTKESLS